MVQPKNSIFRSFIHQPKYQTSLRNNHHSRILNNESSSSRYYAPLPPAKKENNNRRSSLRVLLRALRLVYGEGEEGVMNPIRRYVHPCVGWSSLNTVSSTAKTCLSSLTDSVTCPFAQYAIASACCDVSREVWSFTKCSCRPKNTLEAK